MVPKFGNLWIFALREKVNFCSIPRDLQTYSVSKHLITHTLSAKLPSDSLAVPVNLWFVMFIYTESKRRTSLKRQG